ncbi:MAG TPA: methionyl-tRNA formyltransferase [Candidatus Binataceae bacterium]|nr:methionyl-tRNA formyltransferase [Candidatus Binataceae bacterium]
MRIALIGQAAFAERALEVLHARGENIVHVYAPPEVPGARPDPLKTRALAIGLPVSQPESFRTDEVFGHFKSLDADLAIMAFVTLIVPERILYAPRLKSICFHPSLLPRHRGASAINWAIIQGDADTGVTWFWPDRGIDTGPILIQRRVPIHDEDTTGSIYFNRLFPMGIDTMVEAVELIKQGMAPSVAQDERDATYEPPCRDEHARLDFDRPAREIFNLIRGCDPQPGAYANLGAERIRLFEPALAESAANTAPGTIISMDKAGMKIALSGASMIVKRVRLESSGKKVAPEELARAGLIAPMARLR